VEVRPAGRPDALSERDLTQPRCTESAEVAAADSPRPLRHRLVVGTPETSHEQLAARRNGRGDRLDRLGAPLRRQRLDSVDLDNDLEPPRPSPGRSNKSATRYCTADVGKRRRHQSIAVAE